MLKIAICDDNKDDVKSTYLIINKYFKSKDIEYDIVLFKDAKELLQNAKDYNLIFLDIELGNENGIEVARKINKMNIDYKLFLVSNHSEYLKDGYRVKADRFFTKPINYDEFIMDMEEVIKDYILKSSFVFDSKISKQKIYIRDILFIEILARKTYLHTRNRTFLTPCTLSYWIETLKPYSFSQTHKAFFVNLQNIEDYNSNEIYFFGYKQNVPLSRFYRDNFINDYMYFISLNI